MTPGETQGTDRNVGEDPTSSAPYISVIVMASRHREYVLEAIKSVHEQSLDRKQYELVVVRDFEDSSLNDAIARHGCRSVIVGPGDIGPAIGAGLNASRGRVLAFLDDDDRFLPRKLETLRDAFRQDPTLGFYRNGYIVINSQGAPLPDHPFRSSQRRNGERLGPVTLEGHRAVAEMRRLPPLGLDFNSSCIAVRRDLMLEFAQHLDLLGFRLLDGMAFFAALSGSASLRVDPTVLTEYRIHSRNASFSPEQVGDAVERRAAFSKVILPSYARLADTVRATGGREVIEEAEGLLEVHRAYAALRNPSSTRTDFRRLRRALIQRRASYLVRSEVRLGAALRLFSISPGFGRWLYNRELESAGA